MVDREALGPAEAILNTLLTYSDHMVHNRPGIVIADPTLAAGVSWSPVTHREEGREKVVYRLRSSSGTVRGVRVGVLREDGRILSEGREVGRYQPAGLFPEVAAWMYRQIAEVWRMDNEFCARWASFAFAEDHRDLKVALAAFMLVQSRKGEPVMEGGQVLFHDEDHREVGEAMLLLRRRDRRDLNPKLLLRVHDLLRLPAIAEINRELGFGLSARNPFLGRWTKAVRSWLENREANPKVLEALVKAGFRTSVIELSRRARFRPKGQAFFETLRWKQVQAKDGHRSILIGEAVAPPDAWTGLSEAEICQRIVTERPSYKRLVGLVPKTVGLTRAVMAAAVEAGSLSDKDLVILTPTLEDLGLLEVSEVKARWSSAARKAEDMRAANVAARVRDKEAAEALRSAADEAVKAAVEEVIRNIRVYFMVDISGSMDSAIDSAKGYIAKFLHAFPLSRLHVSVFNSVGRELTVRHASSAGVEQAFRGIRAGGGTKYGAGVKALAEHRPRPNEDVLFFFVGDEQATEFEREVLESGLRPMAFGLVRVKSAWGTMGTAVQDTASKLGIPCLMVDERTFEDVYAIPRTVRNLVASTPVRAAGVKASRVSLVDRIMRTKLLEKPAWSRAHPGALESGPGAGVGAAGGGLAELRE